jgi:foldase protein PrsA
VVLCAVIFGVGVGGCGGGKADDLAVRVGNASITSATVEHWMSVIAGEVSTAPGQPVPETPVPPHYSACISYTRRFPTALASARSSAPSQLKRECAFEFQKEKLKALYFLISSDWVSGEAAELGVSLTGRALERQLALLKARFPSETKARRFLVGARGTTEDLRSRLTQILLMRSVQQKLEQQSQKKNLTLPQRQQVLDRFGERFEKTWRARTSCRAGYVVPICRQYRAPNMPPALVPPTVPLTKMTAY